MDGPLETQQGLGLNALTVGPIHTGDQSGLLRQKPTSQSASQQADTLPVKREQPLERKRNGLTAVIASARRLSLEVLCSLYPSLVSPVSLVVSSPTSYITCPRESPSPS